MNPSYPLLFHPVYKRHFWGGDRISRVFGRDTGTGTCAESWEISARPEGMSVVSNGPLCGKTLGALCSEHGPALLGTEARSGAFPLLVKIIDARLRLSVQVHPSDETAGGIPGAEPKTEMWYVLQTEPDAMVYAGLKNGVDRTALRKAVADGGVEDLLVARDAVKDASIFVPGGMVHAICEGCLLLEVQQNSDTTFRLYDWDRVGPDGKKRALHVEKALKAIDWAGRGGKPAGGGQSGTPEGGPGAVNGVVSCAHFTVERLDLDGAHEMELDGKSFRALFVADGAVRLVAGRHETACAAGVSSLLPASAGHCRIEPMEGPARVLMISPGPASFR